MGRAIDGLGGGRIGGQLFSRDLPINLAGREHKARLFHFSVLPLGCCAPQPPPPLLNRKQWGQLLATAPGTWGPETDPDRGREGREGRGSQLLLQKPCLVPATRLAWGPGWKVAKAQRCHPIFLALGV